MSLLTQHGSALIDMGYTIAPLSTGYKYPERFNWRDAEQSHAAVEQWAQDGYTGVCINTHNLAAIDIDVYDKRISTALANMVTGVAGLGGAQATSPIASTATTALAASTVFSFFRRFAKHSIQLLPNKLITHTDQPIGAPAGRQKPSSHCLLLIRLHGKCYEILTRQSMIFLAAIDCRQWPGNTILANLPETCYV